MFENIFLFKLRHLAFRIRNVDVEKKDPRCIWHSPNALPRSLTRLFGPANRTIPVLPNPSLDCVTPISDDAAATTVMNPNTTFRSVLSTIGRVRETRAYD